MRGAAAAAAAAAAGACLPTYPLLTSHGRPICTITGDGFYRGWRSYYLTVEDSGARGEVVGIVSDDGGVRQGRW